MHDAPCKFFAEREEKSNEAQVGCDVAPCFFSFFSFFRCHQIDPPAFRKHAPQGRSRGLRLRRRRPRFPRAPSTQRLELQRRRSGRREEELRGEEEEAAAPPRQPRRRRFVFDRPRREVSRQRRNHGRSGDNNNGEPPSRWRGRPRAAHEGGRHGRGCREEVKKREKKAFVFFSPFETTPRSRSLSLSTSTFNLFGSPAP